MLDNPSGNPPGTDPGTRGQGTEGDDSITAVIDTTSDHDSDGIRDDRGLVNVGLESNDDPDSTGRDSLSVDFGDRFGDDGDELPAGDAGEHELSFRASSEDFGELDVDLSPWAPLLGMLDSTESEEAPGDRPFTPNEGVEGAHALELRAESMLQYAERGAQRTGELDRTEVGLSDDNRDVVAGRDQVEIDGMLEEHTGHGLVHIADDVEMNVGGPLRMHAHLEDNIIMAGVMRDEFAGGTFVTAAMSDDMAAGLGLRCTAPLDVWVHGLVGMEERPGTCAADGILLELAGTLYEREYGPSAHLAAVARFQGTTATTMKTGFRPLMKTALGVRNLIPGGGGGGGQASASPPSPPPAPGGGEAAGAATLTAAEGGGALGRGAAGADDTDEIASVVRTVESVSETAEVEELQHPASTADNLDDLARIDVEGEGYRQVAEIYDQPLPASAAPEPDAAPGSGSDSAAAGSGYKKAPELDLTEPGAEGYDFQNAYGPLREQVEHYRADSNWRGNLFTREYLQKIDAKAKELLDGLEAEIDAAAIAGDNRNYKTANIYAAMEQMASEAEAAGNLQQLAKIQDAMAQLEEFVQVQLVDVAARTDEFAGTAFGSQRLAIDPNIDTQKLRSWLEEQKLAAFNACMDPATPAADLQNWSWTRDYYEQLLWSLDAGMNPLAESSEQTIFIQAAKVDAFNQKHIEQTVAQLVEAGLDPTEFDIIPPRSPDQDQLDVYLELHGIFVETLSDPEFHLSAAEVGDHYMAALPNAAGPGPDLDGPDSLRPLGGVDEPDVNPVLGADDPPPPPPDQPVADSSPGAGPDAAGGAPSRRQPDPLYATQPGTDGYEFEDAYGSLHKRNQYYREEFLYRGNFYTREYLKEIDAQAWKLYNELEGPAGAIAGDNFGYEASSIRRTLQTMAQEADDAGDAGRAARIRAAIAEIDGILASKLAEVGTRVDEFSGVRVPVDRAVDTEKLRAWLQDQVSHAEALQAAAETDEARQRATWEWGYYLTMVQTLDAGGDPLAVSNEQIGVLSIYSAESAASSSTAADEVALYISLQDGLLATLADPEFHRSTPAQGAPNYAPGAHSSIEAARDLLGSGSLRPFAEREVPPPLPAADFADSAVYVDEVRDRSFSRSGLAASEETLERQATTGLAQGDASVRSSATVPDAAPPEPSFGTHRAPPDSARAPVIDEQSGRWVVEPPAEPGTSPAPGTSTPAHGDAVPPQASDISWESGLLVAGDSEVGPAAGSADDVDGSDLFKAASEPEDVDPEAVDEMRPSAAPNDDGASGSPTTLPDGSGGEDGNPTGTVSEPGDSTSTSGLGDGAGPGRSGATSPVTPDTPESVPTGTPRNPPGTDATPPGATATDAGPGAAGTRSDLYTEPVSFEGRSLEGASPSDDPKELARSLDGAEIPVDDLPRVEPDAADPGRRSILKNSDGRPVSDTYADLDELEIRRRIEQAGYNKRVFNDSTIDADSVWRDTMWSGDRREVAALREANSRWSEFTAAQRTSTVSFSDDPRQLLYHVEPEATVYSRRRRTYVDLYRGADPPNTIDRAHAAHYIPRPGGWESTRETGFGRLAQGWNDFPFSPRERIVNSLQMGEALSPDQIISLELGLESYRAAGGELSSSQHRAMVDMISDLGDQYRHARWSMEGEPGQRLLQLIEMLDYAAVAV